MSVRSYVLSKYMSGTSDDTIQLDVTQLMDNGSYAISDPKGLIAYDIFAAVENFIDPQYTDSVIRGLLDRNGKYKLSVIDSDGGSVNAVIVSVDNASGTYYYDVRGSFIARQVYHINCIDDRDLRYLVSDHIIAPFPGVSLIERCYRPCFIDRYKAERYQAVKMSKYFTAHGISASGYRIFAVDDNVMQKSAWYNDNLEIARQIKEYNLDAENYRYTVSLQDIFMAIKADAYDELPADEQAKINRDVYMLIRDYVPEEELPFIDEDMDSVDSSGVEAVTDHAIAMAFANAPDAAAFDAIHKLLGPNDYRVGALTDDIYNEHPDEGYILATRDGEIRWYDDCYFMNEWPEAKDNPYFGKFQKNVNDVLLCFKEFHPELIVDSFPSDEFISKWESCYLSAISVSKQQHPEIQYDVDDDGEIIVIGNWYFAGLLSKRFKENISFHRVYGSHTFTPDECRKLLSGDEIVVENFITKMDMETTIRGKLKDCSGLYDDDMNVEFVRTDINVSKQRRQLNMELGIDEAGLPPAPSDGSDDGV